MNVLVINRDLINNVTLCKSPIRDIVISTISETANFTHPRVRFFSSEFFLFYHDGDFDEDFKMF